MRSTGTWPTTRFLTLAFVRTSPTGYLFFKYSSLLVKVVAIRYLAVSGHVF